jgi:hypothetical protein
MALVDRRAKAQVSAGKHKTSGRMAVTYVDAKRRTRAATVLGPGTSSGLKLQLADIGRTILDNVPAATTRTSTNCYVSR